MPTSSLTAAAVAKAYDIDPRAFRRWLRKTEQKVTENESAEQCIEIVKQFLTDTTKETVSVADLRKRLKKNEA
jgi:histone H3/H4